MTFNLPMSFREVVDEITRFAELPADQVEHRVWMEALVSGYNVLKQCRAMGVTAHVYDEAMERLYQEGDGFIFETMTFWASPIRLTWLQQALERVQHYQSARGLEPSEMRMLIFGDGSGNDSLFFASHGLKVDYFDRPGSRTFDFATRRFAHYQVLGDPIRVVTELGECPRGGYDVVMSFEVLEHLPDPTTAIRDMAHLLKPGGIALVTESFAVVSGSLPTHLASNLQFEGKAPELFAAAGLAMTFDSPITPRKPMEFTRNASRAVGDMLRASWANARRRGLVGQRFKRVPAPKA